MQLCSNFCILRDHMQSCNIKLCHAFSGYPTVAEQKVSCLTGHAGTAQQLGSHSLFKPDFMTYYFTINLKKYL